MCAQAYAPAPAAAGGRSCSGRRSGSCRRHRLRDHPGAVKSPMVGTVYLQAEEGAPKFVKVGDTVNAGATLLLIEAMKTFNPVTAPRGGKVVADPDREPAAGRIRRTSRHHRVARDVRENPHCEPWRDRPPRAPRVQGDGHPHGGHPFRSRPQRHARPPRGRERVRGPRVGREILPEHPRHHHRRQDHRRAGDPPRLRLPVGERQVRRDRREERHHLHRPAARNTSG